MMTTLALHYSKCRAGFYYASSMKTTVCRQTFCSTWTCYSSNCVVIL